MNPPTHTPALLCPSRLHLRLPRNRMLLFIAPHRGIGDGVRMLLVLNGSGIIYRLLLLLLLLRVRVGHRSAGAVGRGLRRLAVHVAGLVDDGGLGAGAHVPALLRRPQAVLLVLVFVVLVFLLV